MSLAGLSGEIDLSEAAKIAFELGEKARAEGKGLDAMPMGYRAARSLAKAWRKGYDSAAPRVQFQEPVMVTQEVEIQTRGQYLGKTDALPETYKKGGGRWGNGLTPCLNCRIIRLPTGSQAVMLERTFGSVAFLKCRSCYHAFKLRMV